MTKHMGMVLGITGRAGSGKNTVAEMLQRELGGEFKIACEGFADSLKLSAARALGFDPADTREAIAMADALKTCGSVSAIIEHGPYDVQEARISGREFLQRYGTESHRDVFGYDFWVDQVIPPGGFTDPDFDLKIITDLRFENEVKRIREVDGLIWRVYRPGRDGADTHVSEAGIADDEINWSIFNDGTLESLADRVRPLAAQLRRRLADDREVTVKAGVGNMYDWSAHEPGAHEIELSSGRYLDVQKPDPSAITLGDVANGLAFECRFGRQCRKFFSVAQHAINCSFYVQRRGFSVDVQLAALHHDDHEAFLGDVARPIKSLLPGYKELAAGVDLAIWAALGLPTMLGPRSRAAVKEADNWALLREAHHLLPSGGARWFAQAAAWDLDVNVSADYDDLLRRFYTPDEARELFLLRHGILVDRARAAA